MGTRVLNVTKPEAVGMAEEPTLLPRLAVPFGSWTNVVQPWGHGDVCPCLSLTLRL